MGCGLHKEAGRACEHVKMTGREWKFKCRRVRLEASLPTEKHRHQLWEGRQRSLV